VINQEVDQLKNGSGDREEDLRNQSTNSLITDSLFTISGGLLDFPGSKAASADVDDPGGAVDDGAHPLDVGVPLLGGDVMGVTDLVAVLGPLAANLTSCGGHENASLSRIRLPRVRVDAAE
jgi:hypothetical protein